MQTIYLDISNKGVIPTIYAKQGDVGRKFEVVLTDSGLPYIPVGGSSFSVWYSGESGDGNYTEIGGRSAFSVNGNKVTVEMIAQMLSNDGDGILSLVLNDISGNQIGLWNVSYICEAVPGSDSEGAKDYYTAFSKSVEKLSNTEEILKKKLSVDGSNSMTADLPMGGHKVTGLSEPISNGDAINLGFANENYRASNWLPTIAEIGAAPAGYGLGMAERIAAAELDDTTAPGFYDISETMTINNITANYWYLAVYAYGAGSTHCTQTLRPAISNFKNCVLERTKFAGDWYDWECVNPPMTLGVEYRTTERFLGKPVYCILIDMGLMPNASVKRVNIGISNMKYLVHKSVTAGNHHFPCNWNDGGSVGNTDIYVNSTTVSIKTTADWSRYNAYAFLKYTKTTD